MHRTDRTALAAIGGGVLVAGSIAAELVHHVQAPDGTVLEHGAWAGYLTAFTMGAGLLLRAAVGVGGRSRAARIGRGMTVAGFALVLGAGLLLLPSGLITGTPLEWGFVPFAIGLLLSAAGGLTLGAVTREPALVVAGAGALVAVAMPSPAHDVGMLVFVLSWAALGALRLRTASPREAATV